jgi:hypothetical protein
MNDHDVKGISFGGGGATSVAGIIGGVIFATGVPFVILKFGEVLSPAMVTGIVIGSIAIGGLVALTSAFFGLVMPSNISEKWREYEREDWKRKNGDSARAGE